MWYFGKVKNTKNDWGYDAFETTFDNPIEVTDEEYDKLVELANKEGKWISGDKDGKPILVDPPEPNEKEKTERRIQELQQYLESTDWYAIRFADTGEEIPADIKKKRQNARVEISELRQELKIE